jgi:biopolymer transport protein ExbB
MRKLRIKNGRSVLTWICLALFVAIFASPAQAWWNDQWQNRKKITLDTTAAGADIRESLQNVPVLIRLHSGNFDFTRAQNEGEDLRFVGSDDIQLLKHHIERFDPLDEIALIWVRLPRISGGSDADFLWLYYGNEDAAAAGDANGTFDVQQAAVFHFDEIDGLPQDATANDNHPTEFTGGQGLPAVIGYGITLNGAGDRMILPAAPTLNLTNGFTLTTWIRMGQPQEDAYLFFKGDETASITVGINDTSLYARIVNDAAQIASTELQPVEIPTVGWQHVAVTAAPNGPLVVYLNGVEAARTDLPGGLPGLDSEIAIGASTTGANYFAGELDEIAISNVARLPGWITAAYASQGPEGNLYAFGIEQTAEGGGLPVFYLATVMKNITLDGWVIIGILISLMVTSWMIIINKSVFTWLIDRENKRFIEAYNAGGNPISFQAEEGQYANASLHKLYQAGKRIIQPMIDQDGDKTIPRKAMDAFKAALERGYIEESKRINAWLVVLTFAITGGPFLGLLGTVWGVMNTFAAMAEAGEASIMAIAPGVASALSTTVFGLIVAIPALFAYNFITSKIKSITVDMNVFIDEYILKVQQAYLRER